MDPLSQAGLGASLSQSFVTSARQYWPALIIGALAGMAPDLDVLINSREDPLLFLEYHRQFTHSLVFIPVGALICALIVVAASRISWLSTGLSFRQIYLFSLLGYATHGLLDACTSYGTQLFWPFSTERFAWNTVSIIDPLFSIPVLALVIVAAVKKQRKYASIAFVYALLFMAAGQLQKMRAETAMYALAESRGHVIVDQQVKPSFGNRIVWKLIYEADGYYYVDAVRLWPEPEIIEGDTIRKLDVKSDFPWLPPDSQQAKDIERFRWFSAGFLAVKPDDPNVVFDVRYSFLPNEVEMMWGIELDHYVIEQGMLDRHVDYTINNRVDSDTRRRFMDMVFSW